VDELRGKKMRFFGLGAKVMEKFGVSTQLLAAGDIYPALELGTIDATEFSMPAMDEGLGFFQVAKHYYFPGWHQQATLGDLIVNKANFDKLSDGHKAMLEVACGFMQSWNFTHAEAVQGGAMQRMKEKGVTVHTWPDETLAKFEAAWKQVAEEEAAKDPLFKKILESYTTFRAEYAVWKANGYLK
jgi:TRAP-type mannitol/chloroaromatic compound transport system substrate-binding protein